MPGSSLNHRIASTLVMRDSACSLTEPGRGDYAAWFQHAIRDEDLAREVTAIGEASDLQPSDSRRLVRDAIERRYMLPYGP